MTHHDAAAIARRLYDEVWNARRDEAAGDLFDPEFHTDAAPGFRGGAAKLAAIRGYHTTFPDLRITIDDLITGGDRVAARWTVTGTDTGGLKGKPPTGRPIRAWGAEHLGIRDGKIVSDWVGADWLGILIQLGAIPNPWPP
jgi:predicted ester cyclase